MFRNEMKCRICKDFSTCKSTPKYQSCTIPMQEKIKTFDDWEDDLDDYLQVGDQIDEKLYENFLYILPPIDIKANPIVLGGFQVSEPIRDAIDQNGKLRALYSTFGMSGDDYYYLGLNFAGEVNSTYTLVDYTALYKGYE